MIKDRESNTDSWQMINRDNVSVMFLCMTVIYRNRWISAQLILPVIVEVGQSLVVRQHVNRPTSHERQLSASTNIMIIIIIIIIIITVAQCRQLARYWRHHVQLHVALFAACTVNLVKLVYRLHFIYKSTFTLPYLYGTATTALSKYVTDQIKSNQIKSIYSSHTTYTIHKTK